MGNKHQQQKRLDCIAVLVMAGEMSEKMKPKREAVDCRNLFLFKVCVKNGEVIFVKSKGKCFSVRS